MQITVATSGLDWNAAHQAVGAALREAERIGARMNVAVVDHAGTPIAFGRMHGAPLHSIGIAEDKAYTAASFGFSTADWDQVVAGNENLKTGLGHRPRLVMFGGGLPLIVDGECVGGIGCSGGSEEQDEICARAGLTALGLK